MTTINFSDGGTITVQPIDDPVCDVRIETRTGGIVPTGSVVKMTARDAAILIAAIASAMTAVRRESEGR